MGGLVQERSFRDLQYQAREAATKEDPELALDVCKLIAEYDVFIGHSMNTVNPPGEPVKIKIKYPSLCQKCGQPLERDSEVLWVRNVGCWHMGCL